MTTLLHSPDDSVALFEEELAIDKKTVVTGQVRVQTFVDSEDVLLRGTVTRGVVDVQRVPIDRHVAVAPPVREEGELLIIPVLEERLVVEKRLFLVEELHIRRSTVSVPIELPETRRVMRAVVERDTPVALNPEESRT